MYATKNRTSFKVKYRRSLLENEVFEFNELGINKIIHPKYIYRETSAELTNDFKNPKLWHAIGSDWISPYHGITALCGGTSTFEGTVGGNHGTVGGSGFATARNLSAVMCADGREVADGQIVTCEEVKLVVKNYVSASNKLDIETGTKTDSLLETVTYTVTPNNVEVSVHLTALEDLAINGYVGLQMTTNMIAGQAYFNDSANKYFVDGVRHNSLPLPFDGDRMVYADDNNLFVTYTNRKVGLGDLSAKGTSEIHFLSQYNKLYSHLIGGSITLLAGETVDYSGGYTFGVPMKCVGAEKAYFIKLNRETIYCVDFLSAIPNAYFELPTEYHGKPIDIVGKSGTITCDDIITSNGLRISATDFGTLKFRIKNAC